MTGDLSQLTNIKFINGGYVSFAGGETGKITQMGTVSNGPLKFEEVNYVPELHHSLLSVSQICDRNYSVHFTDKECLILKPGIVIPADWILVRSRRQNDAYIIDMNTTIPETVTCLFSSVSERTTMLWHRRLGHANVKNLNRLTKNDLVRDLPIKDFITVEKCVACALGKQHRKPHFPKSITSINKVLQLLHMDLFGPVNVLSVHKQSYCLVIIDDYSRYTWVFFLVDKSETAELVKQFVILMENQTNEKVKGIRCDNGTEFKNKYLNYFCAEKGIQRQYSAVRTPQQNGVAERRNRTLIDAARTMLCDSKLPVFFWAEAINTACYVQNRVLINKRLMKTPYEVLVGHKPTVSHFRTFGCRCTLLHQESTPKFSPKADDCYFVGYGNNTTYRVYVKSTGCIVESYNVRWLEENETDAGVGPSILYNYNDLFTKFYDHIAYPLTTPSTIPSISRSTTCVDDEEEEVVFQPKKITIPKPLATTAPVIMVSTTSHLSTMNRPLMLKHQLLLPLTVQHLQLHQLLIFELIWITCSVNQHQKIVLLVLHMISLYLVKVLLKQEPSKLSQPYQFLQIS